MSFILDSGIHVKEKINCLKEKLKLYEREEGEGEVLILRNSDRSVRVDLQVVQNEDYTISYNVMVSLEKEEYKDIILKCLGQPKEIRVLKPTILDVCTVIVSGNHISLNDLVNNIMVKFNLSESEVKEFFKRITGLSTWNMPATVVEAIKIIKQLDQDSQSLKV